jgi:hypothetical protein
VRRSHGSDRALSNGSVIAALFAHSPTASFSKTPIIRTDDMG